MATLCSCENLRGDNQRTEIYIVKFEKNENVERRARALIAWVVAKAASASLDRLSMARGLNPALVALPSGRWGSRAAVLSPNAESENLGGGRRRGARQGGLSEGSARMW